MYPDGVVFFQCASICVIECIVADSNIQTSKQIHNALQGNIGTFEAPYSAKDGRVL